MDYKDYIKQMGLLPEKEKKVKKESIQKPKVNSVIQDIEENFSNEFNLSERLVYDRNASKPKVSSRMIEMVKRQIKGMEGYKLSRVYETKGSYRMVFESETEGVFEISIKEKR
tara:strand:+ start:261 stop:599 length:339 start_codon:yes stop_codon:yes gene_type:complete